MLDWTGERFVPWAKEAAVAYEHLHRYMWASTLVRGKRVLDLASGEGYGSNLLASEATYVCGVDIDDEVVRHATEKYRRPNLQFLKGSIAAVPIPDNQHFDVIVCFEAIEHIEEQDALLREVKRLLKPDGLFVVSTPNKDVHDAGEASNPFHVKELTFGEFNALLSKHFSSVSYLGQRLHPASSLWPLGSPNGSASPIQEFVVERGEREFAAIPGEKRVPRYFIGIASNASAMVGPGSVLLDHSDELTEVVHSKDLDLRETKAAADNASEWFQEQLDERNEALRLRGAEVEHLNKGVEELNKDLAWLQAGNKELERTMASRDEALAWRADQVDELEKEKIELFNRLEAASGELGVRKQELAEIHLSRGWRILTKLRAVRDRLKRVFGK